MDRKQVMRSVLTILSVLAAFNISPISGLVACPWCDKNSQSTLLNCMYSGMVSRPELMAISLPNIDTFKWQVSSYSDSLGYDMPYNVKKVEMDKMFVGEIVKLMKGNNYLNNPTIMNVMSELAGNCYSSVTGYDRNIVIHDVNALAQEEMKKITDPLGGNSNPNPNSRMPYSPSPNQPQIQPPSNNAPLNPPGSPPESSFGYPPFRNNAPFNPPGSAPVNSFNNPASVNNPPFNPPGSAPVNSFNNPTSVNNAPLNPPVSSPGNSFGNPPPVDNTPLNPPVSQPMSPSNNPSLANNDDAGSTENSPSNDYKDQAQAGSDFSKNQAPSSGPPGPSLQNDNKPPGSENSQDSAALASTTYPQTSSPSQDSKSTDSDSSNNSHQTTLSPNGDGSQKKTAGDAKSDDEEPCDEKFKTALFETLIKDENFCIFFGKFPTSVTKAEVPKIMKHAFKEYGIEEHYKDFPTLWEFESKTLHKESKVDDWDEVISKISKIIFSRNNLLKGDCEEDGKKMANCILDVFPGDTAASSTENTSQTDGNDETSTESNSNSSGQKANPASNSTESASTESSSNSENPTNPTNLSFPQLHSKLANMFKGDGGTDQKDDNVPFSELLSAFELQQNLDELHRSAKSCVSPTGFDFDKFMVSMTKVADRIQTNHPDWSRDKCQKEMYAETVAVLTEELKETMKAKNNNAESQSPSTQPDSGADASDSQSSNSGAQYEAPNDDNLPSDDSEYSEPGDDYDTGPESDYDSVTESDYDSGTGGDYDSGPGGDYDSGPGGDYDSGPGGDYDSGSGPQPQQDFSNYGGNAEGTEPVNLPPSGNQPGNPQAYPAGPPTSMNSQPFPARQNAGFQQPQNFAPDYGVMNPPNGNVGQYQADYPNNNRGFNAGPPVVPNGNTQNFPPQPHQDYEYVAPAARPTYNAQPQFNPNYNSRAPANVPANPQW